jgi:exopolyphosphatase/guanosine-5'-triphosphate,3'-diphosphate pyrophosphatase
LTVEELGPSGWKVLLETSRVTALGSGTAETGVLGERGMTDTLSALLAAFEAARLSGADQVMAAGTMALRIARNAPDFLERARKQETPVAVLSGDDEARLGMECVTRDPLFESFDRVSIVDVGGQSTEIATYDRPSHQELFRRSFPIGTLKLLGDSLREECPSPPDLLRAARAVDDAIGLCFLPGTAGKAVSLGATGTNLISIRERFASWHPDQVHGAKLSYEEVSRFVSVLSAMSVERRSKLIGMEPGRAPTLPAGALILERCLYALGVESVLVSAKGWRHALLEAKVKAEG